MPALLAVFASAVLIGASSASAAPEGQLSTVTIGPAGYAGNAIAAGPDGSMWFTNNANNSIGRITPAGAVTAFPVPASPPLTSGPGLFALTAGPDGNMWFTQFFGNQIGRITPTGLVTMFPVPTAEGAVTGTAPFGITAGPDGNLWFTMDFANAIGRITPNGVITQFPIPSPGTSETASIVTSSDCLMCGYLITPGPDQALWFTIPAASRIGRITVDGAVTTFPVPTTPPPPSLSNPISVADITSAPDGSMWFTQPVDNQIGRITTAGVVTEFNVPLAGASPLMITPGPRGTLWFTETGTLNLGRLDSRGAITQVPISTPGAVPTSLTAGADGNLHATLVVGTPPTNILNLATIGTGSGAMLRTRITGSAHTGSPLACRVINTSGWSVAQVTYQWLRAGQPIPSQSKKTFTPSVRDLGEEISCVASITTSPMLTQLAVTSPAKRIT